MAPSQRERINQQRCEKLRCATVESMQLQEFQFQESSLKVTRLGYGAMQLAGPRASGPPKDPQAAIAVLREVVASGMTHIDTSGYYGPHTTNQIIKEALHPYSAGLVIATKTAPKRVAGGVVAAFSREELIADVHDNLRDLGVDALDVFNLRVGAPICPVDYSVEVPLSVLAELQQQGLIRSLGLSNVTAEQVAEGQKIAPIVCVQNLYNLASRADDGLIDTLAAQHIAYVPYFPLRGFSPDQMAVLETVAEEVGSTASQVALAWLLERSPNILLIPGTSSIGHLHENVQAAAVRLTPEAKAKLETIASLSQK